LREVLHLRRKDEQDRRNILAMHMTLRQFLHDNFGWDIYDWADDEIRF
jgi:hypothetical protein